MLTGNAAVETAALRMSGSAGVQANMLLFCHPSMCCVGLWAACKCCCPQALDSHIRMPLTAAHIPHNTSHNTSHNRQYTLTG